MADVPEIGLTPEARPTDQFVTPYVKRSRPGDQISEIAEALRGFSKTANDIYEQRQAASKQSQQLAADRDFAQANAGGNIEGFRKAVKQGLIHEADVPWYKIQASQDVARNDAKTAYEAAFNAYNNSDIKKSDDPRQVASFVDQQFQPYLQGKDAWEVQAMLPELDHYKNQIINEHVANRRSEIENTRVQAIQSNVKSIADNYTADTAMGLAHGDPEAQKTLENIAATIQKRIDDAGMTMDRTKVNALASQSILEIAREKRDANLARLLMDRIKVAGDQPLSKLGDNRAALDLLPRQVLELQVADASKQEELHNLRVQKDYHTLMDKAGEWAKQNGEKDIWKYPASLEDQKAVAPEAWDEFQKARASAASQGLTLKNVDWTYKGEPVLHKLWEETLSPGGIDPKEQNDLLTQLINLGTFGREAVSQYDYFVKSHKMGTFIWGDTSPQTQVDLYDKLNDPSMDPLAYRKYLLDLAANRKISEADFHGALEHLHARMTLQGAEGPMGLNNRVESQHLIEQLTAAFVDPSNKNGVSLKDLDHDENFWTAKAGAVRALEEGVVALHGRKDYQEMSPEAKLQKDRELVDQVAVKYGGWTAKQLEEKRRNGDPLEAMGLQGANKDKPLQSAKPVEAPKLPEPEPKSASETIDKADPAAKGLESYQKAALANYLTSPAGYAFGFTRSFSTQDYNAKIRDAMNGIVPSSSQPAEQLAWIRHYNPDWNGVTDPDRLSLQDDEIEAANAARQRMKDLAPVANVARKELDGLLSSHDQPLPGSPEWLKNRPRVLELANYVEEYSTLRRFVGFMPEEVKQQGSDAWKRMPMFVNEKEAHQYGEQVAEKLGIKDVEGKNDFLAHQLTLTKLLRQQQGE